MSKMKKIMALLMTVAMVMGMAMTTMAAPKQSATITIKNEDGTKTDAQLSYVQVIRADPTTRTGWAFTTPEIGNAYITAFKDVDAQRVLEKLVNFAAGKKENVATTDEIAKALSTVMNSVKYTPMSNPQEVTEAGVYAIKAYEDGYTYNNMAAYVGFGEVKDENGDVINEYPSLMDVELTAKKAPIDLSKSTTDPDKVVAIGDIVTYTITTAVPFIDPSATNKEFKVWDRISGAEYYFEGEGSHFSVIVGNEEDGFANYPRELDADGKGFKVDLSELILPDNGNAGKQVIITYTAKITDQIAENEAGSNISGADVDSDKEKIYTGSILLTKHNEDKTEQLAGAGFEVRKEGSEELLTFTQKTEGQYVYDPEGAITEVFTGLDGILIIHGLDVGTYNFKETTAPEGYHIKNDPSGIDVTATLKLEDEEVAKDIVKVETELTNTKLSSLPSTGGIGTTIFTIGGCVIMIAAAGLFFANRRKDNK